MPKNQNNKSVCFYFQVHQPYRVKNINVFELGNQHNYFDEAEKMSNKEIFEKVATKCYLPTTDLLLKIIKNHPEFKCSFSLSGVFLEQCLEFGEIGKQVLENFKKLVDTGNVELLNETYYHSLSYFFSKREFVEQIRKHRKIIYKLFKKRPSVFRHTELIYNNEIANFIRLMGFKGVLAEGWDPVLEGQSPNYIYNAKYCESHNEDAQIALNNNISGRKPDEKIKLLLKNYKLSDDIAFRFSEKSWPGWPLTSDKFAAWLDASEGNTINLFMDFETFGEHQWEDTGIFSFLETLPEFIKKHNISFKTPSETMKDYDSRGEIDCHNPISWADTERDLSAWFGNHLQESAIQSIFAMEPVLLNLERFMNKKEFEKLLHTWRKLQTSDHYYYMCTKYWKDGDVHKYFSPYDNPYEAYINFMNALTSFKNRLMS